MDSPLLNLSPSFKNARNRPCQSPIEIKEKMRKSYKEKIHNCRDLFINRSRGICVENEIRNTLTDIYNNMFNKNFQEEFEFLSKEEEHEYFKQIEEEFVQEELSRIIDEYEKSQGEVDWSSIENNDVICPVCQKTNMICINSTISCPMCNWDIQTRQSLPEIQTEIMTAIERHSRNCIHEAQFTAVPDENETHIYLICYICKEMQLLV